MPIPLKLREFIRQIRAVKTAADERTIIQRECAYIRSLFREENNIWRCRNVAKLMYVHMLGYQAHFGQMESLKLIASAKFSEKRLGYLSAMLFLDERQDIHLLMTNSLKKDLYHHNQFVSGLALCTLGAICSPEMCKSLSPEVEKILKASNVYKRKKAALCAYRMIQKVPALVEMFIPATRTLLTEKNHGVLITAVVLITEMSQKSTDVLNFFKHLVPSLVRILKHLIATKCSPEHEVFGVCDPFLQIKILRLLRLLGKYDPNASEIMNDIIAQVATSTETGKNVANAILYETVLSIMDIKAEKDLRVLGVNILGRFLLQDDKNLKYIALNTLLSSVKNDLNAVQRHRNIILECLNDSDISVKKRAMELCFAIVSSNNIQSITEELLIFLKKADPTLKSQCSFNLFICAEVYAPSKRWHIDTIINVLTLAGNFVIDDVVANLIQLISESTSLHSYVVKKLWKQLTHELKTMQPLVQVASWCIGEFGKLLYSKDSHMSCIMETPKDVIEKFESITMSNYMSLTTKEYSITALMKLGVRFPELVPRVKKICDAFETNFNVELQQRVTEFSILYKKYYRLLPSILENMPIMESRLSSSSTGEKNSENSDDDLLDIDVVDKKDGKEIAEDNQVLLDLISGSDNINAKEKYNAVSTFQVGDSSLLDLLGSLDLFSPIQNNDTGNNLMKRNETSNFSNKIITSMVAFEKNSLKIIFEFEKSSENRHMVIINSTASNHSAEFVHDFLLEVAVPKSFQIQMMPPTNNILPANNKGNIKQKLKLFNPTKSHLKVKLRISYLCKGNSVLELVEIDKFPEENFLL